MKKFTSIFLIITMLIVALSGCTSTNNEQAVDEDTQVVEESSIEGSTLTVVAAYGGKEDIFAAFTDDTGVKVEFLDMSSGEVLARTEAEGGKPMADVWFGGGADSFIVAGEKGLLEDYVSDEEQFVDDKYKGDNYWTGISLVTAGFMVNTEILEEKGIEAPRTWQDLLKPEYKDEIAMADPAISGTNYAVVNSILQSMGEEEGWAYLEALNENIPFYFQRGGEPPNKVAAGEMAVGIIPMSGEFVAMEDKFPVITIYPEDGIPWVPAGLAIFRNAENLEAAKAFVDWALSARGQEIIRDMDPRVMVRNDVAIPELMSNINLDNLMGIDLLKFGAQREEILERWAQMIGN